VPRFSGRLDPEAERAAISHLKDNCSFRFEGTHVLTATPVSFYADTQLCELVLEAGTTVHFKRKQDVLRTPAAFYFLFKKVAGNTTLIPLSGGCGNIHIANKWLNLDIDSDRQRLDYARFYFAYSRVGKPPAYLNLPARIDDLRFAEGASEERKWIARGALWRFLDAKTRSVLRAVFEARGIFPGRKRFHAHLPVQAGRSIYDTDLNIWRHDGHISHTLSELLYEDQSLEVTYLHDPGYISLPRYISRYQRLLGYLQSAQAALRQFVYLAVSAAFLAASAICLLFPLEYLGVPLVRSLLELWAGLTGTGDWTSWLLIACGYCVGYFALTTFLALDVETIRASLLTIRPSLAGGRLDEWLHWTARKQYLSQRASRLALWKRVGLALAFLVSWSTYLVIVFTSLQVAYRPEILERPETIAKVAVIFGEQALLYVPVVVYYVGHQLLDPRNLAQVSYPILLLFRLAVGLLVIRRIHRFWASTSRARARRP